MNIENAFLDAMQAAGLDYTGPVIADGILHRIKINGDKAPNSYYVLHPDHPAAGHFGCWKQNIKENWCAIGNEALTDAERDDRDRQWRKQQEERARAEAERQQSAQGTAQAILDAAQPASDDHPYLVRKAVKAYPGLLYGTWTQRRKAFCLLIPLRTIDGALATVEAISPDEPFFTGSNKDFLKGGKKSGAFFVIGDLHNADTIVIAEGYSTTATLFAATSHAAVMAGDAGNLPVVAKAIRMMYPAKPIVIAADNDPANGNPGLTKATAAARAVNATLAIPQFADGETGTDFNDLAAIHGLEAVKTAIEQAEKPISAKAEAQAKKEAQTSQRFAVAASHVDREPRLTWPTVSDVSHLANAYRIQHYYQGQIFYALGAGWLIWTGKFWQADPTNDGAFATGFVSGLSRYIAQEAGTIAQSAASEKDKDIRQTRLDQAENLLKWAGHSEAAVVIASGLKLAKYALSENYDTLNANPWLLNVQNGTLDLRTGHLRPHNPADRITFISPVTYDPSATCPHWQRFLTEVFSGDTEMVSFIQRAIGWSLTGVVEDRALFFLYGNAGKNGKTTLVEVIQKLLGICGETSHGYARKVGADTFMKSKNMDDNQRKAATLAGPRFICTSEVDEEHRLNEQLIKDITGGDTIEGRRLYQEAFTFKPQFKPWMYGNHKPEIRGTDNAIWSRVRLVPFEVSFEGREDRKLPAKLEAELSGILNWAIAGCLQWQQDGLNPPHQDQGSDRRLPRRNGRIWTLYQRVLRNPQERGSEGKPAL